MLCGGLVTWIEPPTTLLLNSFLLATFLVTAACLITAASLINVSNPSAFRSDDDFELSYVLHDEDFSDLDEDTIDVSQFEFFQFLRSTTCGDSHCQSTNSEETTMFNLETIEM
jgi:hypothetical protein